MKQNFVCIIGGDGSGKTTLAEATVVALQERGAIARRTWLGAESYLMAPVRRLLKLGWTAKSEKKSGRTPKQGSGSQRLDYAAEISRKKALSARFCWAETFYVALVWADYSLQLAIKRWCSRDVEILIADRYMFDVAVNLGLTLGWEPGEVVRFIRARLGKLELPQVRVYLKVNPEVALERKSDVFDIAYLKLRVTYYDEIARVFGFTVRDGTLSIEENREWLVGQIAVEMARPYVLYIHSNNTDVGGADKVLALMARHMRDFERPCKGYRVAVVLRVQTDIVDSYGTDGIPIICGSFVRPQISKGIVGLMRFALELPGSLWFFWRLIGRERPDIVHLNDLYDFLPAIIARLRGVPVIWHIRMIVTKQKMRGALAFIMARVGSQSISVSKAVCSHYFPVPVPHHQANVVYDLGNANLVDGSSSDGSPRPEDLPDRGRLVLMVGRIDPWKGQDVFIDAVSKLPPSLRAENVFALVGGEVEAKEDFHAQISRSASEIGVLMLGDRQDVPDLLRSTDISVHSSVTPDPFPGVVIESLLAGAATIGADAGGVPEIITDHVHGRLVPPNDAVELSRVITELLSASDKPRDLFGSAGRARALSLIDSSKVDSAIAVIYNNLIK